MQQIMQRCPITLVSATYDADGQLRQKVISGPKLAPSCLPDEGIYLICRDRGLQIASACDRRRCYITQMCDCAGKQEQQEEYTYTNKTTTSPATIARTNTETEKGCVQGFPEGSGQDYALSRLYFYEAADATRSLRLCFLAHPRPLSLSRDDVFDGVVFDFDSGLDEQYSALAALDYNNSHSNGNGHNNGNSNGYGYKRPKKFFPLWGRKKRPGNMIDILREAWREFLERGDHQFGPVKIFSGPGWGWEDEDEKDENEDGNSNDEGEEDEDEDDKGVDVSEWDDADTPIYTHPHAHTHPRPHDHIPIVAPSNQHADNKKRPRPEEQQEEQEQEDEGDFSFDFDFIDDVIEEDFSFLGNTLPLPCVRDCENSYRNGRARRTSRRVPATKDTSIVDGAEPRGSAVRNAKHATESPPESPPKNMTTARDPLESCLVRAQHEEPWTGTMVDSMVVLSC